MFCPRTDRSLALAAALALAACAAPVESTLLDASSEFDTVERKQKPPPPPPPDAKPKPADACPAPDPGAPGMVSCYAGWDPSGACALPTHCCFGNYSAQHDGECSASLCTWGTISCDGPEDCPSGQRCCAHALVDPEYGITGYKLACQATACGAAPANHELCHPTASAAGTCSTAAATCVSALGADSDLPPSLHLCQ